MIAIVMSSLNAIYGSLSPGTINAGFLSGVCLTGSNNSFRQKGTIDNPIRTFNLVSLKLFTKPAMIINLYRNPFLRLLFSLLVSLPLRLLLDLIFGLLYRNYSIIRSPEEYIGAAIITVFTIETVYFLKRRLNRRFPWEKNPVHRLILEIGINSMIVPAVIVALSFLVKFFLTNVQFIKLSDEILTTVFYWVLLVIIPAFIEFALFLLNRWRMSLAEVERYKKENAEYRFETLRTQVNPHFLFNSFNTLSALVYEDQEKAAGFIRDLSDVYRYVLENRSRETIVLSEEIRFIRSFVYLYQLRFDNKLNVEINISEDAMSKQIAPMTLQLLVENAIKHNVISVKKPLDILISSEEQDYITVSNNLQKKTSAVESSEIGLKNIISRYAYLSSKTVEILETETTFIVKVPLI